MVHREGGGWTVEEARLLQKGEVPGAFLYLDLSESREGGVSEEDEMVLAKCKVLGEVRGLTIRA